MFRMAKFILNTSSFMCLNGISEMLHPINFFLGDFVIDLYNWLMCFCNIFISLPTTFLIYGIACLLYIPALIIQIVLHHNNQDYVQEIISYKHVKFKKEDLPEFDERKYVHTSLNIHADWC